MQYLLLGGLAVVLALLAAAWIFTQMSSLLQFMAQATGAVINAISNRINRANLGLTANIPAQIENFSAQSLKDQQHVDLVNYTPIAYTAIPLERHKYNGTFSQVLNLVPIVSNEVNIASVPRLLDFDDWLPFQSLLDMANRPLPSYPDPKLKRPATVKPPPTWDVWVADNTALNFELPLYSGWRACFNGYVKAAYAHEVDRVANARERQREMAKHFTKRNENMLQAEVSANERYQKAQVLSDFNWEATVEQDLKRRQLFAKEFETEQLLINSEIGRINMSGQVGFVNRVEWMLRTLKLPKFVPREGATRFDPESKILILEVRFPDLSSLRFVKTVELKSGLTLKAANQKEAKEAAAKIYPSLSIRYAAELLKLDFEGEVKAFVVNGWAEYVEQSTGQTKRAYCSSMFATRAQIDGLNVSALDPLSAFSALKGIAAYSLEVTPIAPIMRLDTNDSRFVDAKEILGKMRDGENIASMDWEDFEHLCRELFERAFAGSGAEVKVTQASRDQGVDAVIFDPDPVRGGKIVVQAKRYTNTVDVSAVRDLYGSTMNEGAMKGILVTTSQYGPDAYAFAKDKPLTLLNGTELLGLLEKYGYKFRIDLAEARRLNEFQR